MSTNRSESTLVMIAGHDHDDRYYTQTELGSAVTAGTSGAKLIGAYDEFANSNSNNVQAVLKDFDIAISSAVSGGEVNTASNAGTGGIGVFYQKSIYDLQFKNLRSADGHLILTDDTSRHEIKFETNATNLNTANTIVARDASGNFSAGTITADLAGNASTASQLETARTISLSGDVSGSASFDGSANVTISATVANDSHTHDTRYYTESESDARFLGIHDNADSASKLQTARTISLSGDISGSASFDGSANVTISATVANDSHTHDTRYYTKTQSDNLYADDSHTHTLSDITDSGTAAGYDVGTSAGEIPLLDGSGKISTSVLPALAITETYVVADIAARDALSVQEGDVAIVNDDGSGNPNTYIYDGSTWQELKKPASGVSSVAGKVGDVTLTTDDVSEGSHLYLTNERVQDIVGNMVSSNTENGIAVTYNDSNGKLNFDVNDPTISLSGDVTGSATMTNLGNVTITATVADDSHTHDGRYYTESESDARFLGINAKAADSNKLDNLDSSQFVRSDTSDVITGVHTYQYVNQNIRTYYNYTGHSGGWARGIEFIDKDSNRYGGLGSYGNDDNHNYFYFGGGSNPWTLGMRMYENGNAYFSEDVTVIGTLTADLTGNASTASKLQTARTIALSGDVSGSTSFNGSSNVTITATVANDSHTHDSRYYTESESNTRYLRRNATSLPTADNTYDLGDGSHRWSNMYAVNFNGTATYAKYADLAEKYTIEGINYEVGDVVVLSTNKDVDVEKSNVIGSNCVVGVISENPAFAMNNELEEGIYVGLKGRLMCKVQGPCKKTDSLISGLNGCAVVPNKTMLLNDDVKYFAIANEDIDNDEIKLIEVIL